MPHQGVLQQIQARSLGFDELQVRRLGQVREIGMRLGPQVQLLRSGGKKQRAFRKQTTSAVPPQATRGGGGLSFCPFPRRMYGGRPGGPGLQHLGSLQTQEAQLHSWVAGHGASGALAARRQTGHPPGKQDKGCSITRHPPSPTTLLSPYSVSPGKPHCHLLSHHALSPHQGKVNEVRGLSLPSHAAWAELARKSQSLANPQIWPRNPPVAPQPRQSPLLPRLAALVKGTCTTTYI